MAHRRVVEDACSGATSFIGSFPNDDGPGHGLIVLSGDIDAAAVGRLGVHIDGLLAAGACGLVIEARAADSCDPALLDLLGQTQNRLSRRHGLLQVRGLHPSLLPSPN